MRPQHAAILDEIERRRSQQNVALLRIYAGYGASVALLLLAFSQQAFTETLLGSRQPTLFVQLSVVWGLVNLGLLLLLPRLESLMRWYGRAVFGLIVWDILVICTLLYASHGVESGLGSLLVVTVAIAAILLTGRIAIAVPAIATLGLLYEEFYLALELSGHQNGLFQAGVLGALYFATAFVIQHLSGRIREKDIRSLIQASELADLEQLNRQIIRRMRTGIAVVDPDGLVRMMNDSARELLGVAPNQPLHTLPVQVEEHLRDWRSNVELRPKPFQVNPEGAEIRASFSPVRAGDALGDVIVFLEDTAELQQQALQLKLASLGQLSGNIAHEIRNPLSAISHAAQLLRESPDLSSGDRRLTEIIRNHCQRMNGVIENVLSTSRRQPPNPVRVHLGGHLPNVVAAYRETMPEAEIAVEIDPPELEVRMDRSQLDQVLTNLLSNAVRHSRARTGRSWAKLEAGIDPRSDRPYLDVIDEGRGIDQERAARLFEPFFSTEQGGTGLGLYLSRELCEANQARLNCLPRAADGACFRISFAHPERVIT